MPIPNHAALAGLHVTGQSVVLSLGSNATGLTVSNPLCISLGK